MEEGELKNISKSDIESIYLQREALKEDGQIDLNRLGTVAISGLNNYHIAHRLASYAYARPGDFPENLLQSSTTIT